MFRLEKFMNVKAGIHCPLKKNWKLNKKKSYKNSIKMWHSLSESSDAIKILN